MSNLWAGNPNGRHWPENMDNPVTMLELLGDLFDREFIQETVDA